MRRREFITLVGGAAAAWPLAAEAQQPKRPRIGVLITTGPEPFLGEFRQGVRELGYIEGQNIQLEVRSADSKLSLLRGLADELVQLTVDIIVAHFTPAVIAASQATKEIAIVMAPAGDPVGMGLIASLARPGGNITGLSATGPELGSKLVEFIRAVLPSAHRVAVLANATDPFAKPFVAQIERGGQTMGVAIQAIQVRGVEGFEAAFAAMAREQADAVIVQPTLPRKAAIEVALKQRLPSFSFVRSFPGEGGLLSYSGVQEHRRAAYYVDRLLKGANPADLAVEQPARYEMVIKTAKVLGLTVPPLLLAQADEVIE
jgi:putative tryptophan/tyrosine transport system substrate-binding protein